FPGYHSSRCRHFPIAPKHDSSRFSSPPARTPRSLRSGSSNRPPCSSKPEGPSDSARRTARNGNVMARAGHASAQLRHFTHSVIERFPKSAYGSISSGHAWAHALHPTSSTSRRHALESTVGRNRRLNVDTSDSSAPKGHILPHHFRSTTTSS